MEPPEYTLLESQTREEIDRQLIEAGWVIQDKKQLNLYQSLGVAVREMDTDTGPADYMLFVDGKACGILEAKREGTNLGDVVQQSRRYALSQTQFIMCWLDDLPYFASDDDHCDRIVNAVREVFNEGNAICKKITVKVGKKTSEESIKVLLTDRQYRIAVTVDKISAGTDIRSMEFIMFMRDVKS
ncbi:MAG: hypothetical protein ABW101_18930 [Candidatus Thiodiazotropha sp.]